MPGLKSADGSRALIMCPQSVENSLRNTLRMASLLNSKSGVHGAPGTLGTRGTHGPLTRPGTRTTLIILSTLSMASISGASSVLAELNSVDALSELARLKRVDVSSVLAKLNTVALSVLVRLSTLGAPVVDQAERTEHSEHGRAGPFGGTVRSGNAGPVKSIAELGQPRSIGAARQGRYTGTGNRSARRKADRSVELEGGLEILDLSRLLRLIRAGRKSGTLVLRQDGKKGLIYWQEGAIVGAMHGGWEGREALRRLFQWKRGSFQFIRGPVPVGSLVGERWESVVLDGARSVSDPELWEKAVPRDECAPRKRRALDRIFLRQLLTYQEWQLLNHVDGNRTVEDLAQLLHWPIEQVRRHMYPLLAIGAVECVDAVEPKVRQKSARVRPRRGERSGASTSKATAIARRRARQPHGKREVKVISLDSARRNAK